MVVKLGISCPSGFREFEHTHTHILSTFETHVACTSLRIYVYMLAGCHAGGNRVDYILSHRGLVFAIRNNKHLAVTAQSQRLTMKPVFLVFLILLIGYGVMTTKGTSLVYR